MEVKIKQGDEMLDATIEMINGIMVVSPKEVKFEPKDGDVVYLKSRFKHILIYKESTNGYLYSFADLLEGRLDIDDNPVCYESKITEIRPATEEEKKLLFDKLKEEGWEWDAEKKELVKLKWKPKADEEYFTPVFTHTDTFHTTLCIWEDLPLDTNIYNKKWCFKTEEECQAFCDRLNDAINSVKP